MAENISSAMINLERLLSDAAIKSAMGDTRLALLGAHGQGLTLVYFSTLVHFPAQPEPFLQPTQPLIPSNIP